MSFVRGHSRVLPPTDYPMTGHRDLLAVIRAYMANDDADGLADDLLITLQLDADQLDQLSDLKNGL